MLYFKCVLYTRLWATWEYNVRWYNDRMPNQMNEWMDIFPMKLSVYPYTKLILFWISVSNWLNYLFREISFRKSIKMTIKTHIKSGQFLFSLLLLYSNERYFALKILKYFISAMYVTFFYFKQTKHLKSSKMVRKYRLDMLFCCITIVFWIQFCAFIV